MNTRTSKPLKRVLLTLPPGDPGPICSYSPLCSPSDQNLAAWREATLEMWQTELKVPPNDERDLIERWILQMVRRELAGVLAEAEKKVGHPLVIRVDATTAEVIGTALGIRAARLKKGAKRRGRRKA